MQGTSQSWQRLNRMRTVDMRTVDIGGSTGADAGAGLAAHTGPIGDPGPVVDPATGSPVSVAPGGRWVPEDEWGSDVAGPVRSAVGDPEPDAPVDLVGDEEFTPTDPTDPTGPVDRRRPEPRWRAGLRRWFCRSAQLWVPEAVRGARVDPGRRGVMALLLVAALAASITAVGVWRDRPEPGSSATVSVVGGGADDTAPTVPTEPGSFDGAAGSGRTAPGTTDADASGRTGILAANESAPPTEIVVSVTGLVVRPGVVTLPAGSRVADAITAAGGLTAEADVTGLNLAERLEDGASVTVTGTGGSVSGGSGSDGSGSGGPAGRSTGGADRPAGDGGGTAGSGATRVDLNTADATELDTLPGVGPVMAGNIITWREQNGPFTSVEQLQEITGIGPARYAQLVDLVVVG